MKTTIFLFHPDIENSHINKKLIESCKNIKDLTIHNVFAENNGYNIDVEKEQKLLFESDIIILQSPFYWYSLPAIEKLWFERIISGSLSFGTTPYPLAGKKVAMCITTGRALQSYQPRNHGVKDYITSYLDTLFDMKLELIDFFVVNNAPRITEEELTNEAKKYIEFIKSLPNKREYIY